MNECIETEVLIIGSGIAGGTAALELAEAGIPVTLVTRSSDLSSASTYWAQGGIVFKGRQDSPQLLVEDILNAGSGHGNPEAIQLLAESGPQLVQQILIDRLGIAFDQESDGQLSLNMEGGHQVARILHVTDATGKSIENALIDAVSKHPNVNLLKGVTAIDLLTPGHHSLSRTDVYKPSACVGAYLLDRKEELVIRCLARKTILATGGLGQIYLRTTNPSGARGDGLAMANRASARIINAEFIQFHPTTFFHQYLPPFLITEAVRGAGARLAHADGQPFMQKYEPEWKDLAPRDIVARCIHKEMLLRDVPNVFLDLFSYISTAAIKDKFPTIYEKCLQYGVDITNDLVPVVPGAHYFCGGVWADEWGRTTLENFYAVGEVSCTGVHGANRLASTSLLEGLVWGRRSAQHITQSLAQTARPKAADIPSWRDAGLEPPDPALISQDMSSIRNIMWNYVGLVRTSRRLQRALRELRNLENEIERFYRVARLTDGLLGLRNAVRTALIVTAAAWENKNSMGCHYRE
jgi:L-aspartate oxidase